MSFLRKNFLKLLAVVFLLLFPLISLAQQDCDPTKQICNPIKSKTIQEVIETFLKGALKIGIPIIVLAIIYCGFLFVAARGNSEKITQAKDALFYTLIGAAVLLGAYALAQLIAATVQAL